MATYTVQSGDYASRIAQKFTGNGNRWPELCAANPQLAKHATAGCAMYPGNVLTLPASWVPDVPALPAPTQAAPVAVADPIPTPLPTQQVSPTGPTVVKVGEAVDDQGQLAPTTAAPPAKNGKFLKIAIIGGSTLMVAAVAGYFILRRRGEEE